MRVIKSRLVIVAAAAALASMSFSVGTALAHAYPKTMDPTVGARLESTPAHITINYDSAIVPSGMSTVVMDDTGAVIPTTPDPVQGNTYSVSPTSDLPPGPYTVAWTSMSGEDGHIAQGFYTFVVSGGPVGILSGTAQSQTSAAELIAMLTVMPADDGSSLLRVDLNNTTGVERVRIRLSGPDLGEDLLDTTPSGDGGWVLNGNEVAVPGAWQAQVIVRRQNIFDDAMGTFNFNVDALSGLPSFGAADVSPLLFGPLRLAHAQYASSNPPANSTVPSTPSTLTVTWTQELAALQFTITGPDGSNVVNGPAKINLEERHTGSVPIRDAGPGQYFVLWHNVSGDDGDPNDGSFVFTVAGAPAAAAPAPAAAPAVAAPAPASVAAVACIDNGIKTPGIADARVDTYCKRQAIRDQYKGKINELVFNYDLSIGMGFENSLKDAMGLGG